MVKFYPQWLNLNFIYSRRQKEIDDKKKNSGITEDDLDDYFKSQVAIKAEKISWQSGSMLRRNKSLFKTVQNHLVTSIILDNYGRNSEVFVILYSLLYS